MNESCICECLVSFNTRSLQNIAPVAPVFVFSQYFSVPYGSEKSNRKKTNFEKCVSLSKVIGKIHSIVDRLNFLKRNLKHNLILVFLLFNFPRTCFPIEPIGALFSAETAEVFPIQV